MMKQNSSAMNSAPQWADDYHYQPNQEVSSHHHHDGNEAFSLPSLIQQLANSVTCPESLEKHLQQGGYSTHHAQEPSLDVQTNSLNSISNSQIHELKRLDEQWRKAIDYSHHHGSNGSNGYHHHGHHHQANSYSHPISVYTNALSAATGGMTSLNTPDFDALDPQQTLQQLLPPPSMHYHSGHHHHGHHADDMCGSAASPSDYMPASTQPNFTLPPLHYGNMQTTPSSASSISPRSHMSESYGGSSHSPLDMQPHEFKPSSNPIEPPLTSMQAIQAIQAAACAAFHAAAVTNQSQQKQKKRKPSRPKQNYVCANCQAVKTPLWRKGDGGKKLCNKCGLYWSRHQRHRPLELGRSGRRQTTKTTPNGSSVSPQNYSPEQLLRIVQQHQQADPAMHQGAPNQHHHHQMSMLAPPLPSHFLPPLNLNASSTTPSTSTPPAQTPGSLMEFNLLSHLSEAAAPTAPISHP